MVIYIDNEKINKHIAKVEELQKLINDNKDIIESNNIKINYDFIYNVKYKMKEVQTKYYQLKLKELCEEYGQDYEKAKYMFAESKYDFVKDVASEKSKDIRNFISNVHNIVVIDFDIDVVNKVFDDSFNLVSNYKEVIKEVFTYNTQNNKQEKVLTLLNKLVEVMNDLKKYSINSNNLMLYISQDNKINKDKILKL